MASGRMRGVAALLAGVAGIAKATSIEVTTSLDDYGADPATCSLREAIRAANTDTAFSGCPAGSATDLITLGAARYVLTREGRLENANSSGDLDIDAAGTVVIVGTGAGQTFIDAQGIDRVFDFACRSDMAVQLIGMTIRGGDAGNDNAGGGGIRQCAGTRLNLTGVHVTDNSAGRGGGMTIASGSGEVAITRSAFTRNHAIEGDGGAIRHNGTDPLALTNTTISENVTQTMGALSATAAVTMKNVTVAANTSGQGTAGVRMTSGRITLDNSIIADNAARAGTSPPDLYCLTDAMTYGYNIIETRDCDFVLPVSSDLAVDPMLGTLADAGRALPVHVLLPGSPAINSGAPVPNDGSQGRCASTDQRSIQRQQCDRGAFEGRVDYAVTSTADAPDSNPGNGICQSTLGGCTLRAALMEAARQELPIVISIPAGVFEVNIPGRLEDQAATGDLDIRGIGDEARILIGQGPDQTIIRSNGSDRVFDTYRGGEPGSAIGLFGMRIEGGDTFRLGSDGSVLDGAGARFLLPRALTIDRVWFDRNRGGSSGGGLSVTSAADQGPAVRITRSAFTRNTAVREGGGIAIQQSGDASIRSSVIAHNTAGLDGGGIATRDTLDVELSWLTITGNVASGNGGGVALTGGETVGSVIIAGNRDGLTPSKPDCAAHPARTVSSGYNLIGSAGGCVLAGDSTGNVMGADVQLAPVNLVGAGMPYAAPRVGSVAIAAVPQARCRRGWGQFQLDDPQGNARPVAGRCTIGALERTSDILFAHGMDDGYPGE